MAEDKYFNLLDHPAPDYVVFTRGVDEQFNPDTGQYEPAIPLPFYWGLIPWAWKRLTGWRDEYGRKAQLCWQWPEGPEED